VSHPPQVRELCRELSGNGVMPGRLISHLHLNRRWTAQFIKRRSMDAPEAKELVGSFLRRAYDAHIIKFYRQVGSSENEFMVTFETDQL